MEIKLPIEVREIQNFLPHRFPFLLLDRVIAAEPGKSLTAIKNVTGVDAKLSTSGGTSDGRFIAPTGAQRRISPSSAIASTFPR